MAIWSVDLRDLADAVGEDAERVCQQATFDLLKAVIMRSPVDTGRFRANWQLSQGAPATGVRMSTFDPRGSAALTEAARALAVPVGGVVYFVNNLPYAERLEYGWSKQAPSGMVRLSVREFNSHIQRAIAATK